MDRVKGLFRWLGTAFIKKRFEDELSDELRMHIELEIEENIRSGMSSSEARRAALRDFGGLERTREQVRETGTVFALETLFHDLRFGFRRMVKKPGFTVIAVVMIGLGISANTTIYSVFQQVMLEPLPFEESDRIYRVWGRNDEQGWQFSSLSQPNYIDLRDRNTAFEEFGAWTFSSRVLTGSGDPMQPRVGLASTGLFRLLGIEPLIGRNFLPEEDADGIDPQVALLSYELWQNRFDGDPEVIGRSIVLNDRPLTVVGVLPRGEYWLEWYDLYLPLTANPEDSRGNNIIWAYGKLKEGVTIDRAQESLDALSLSIAEEFPENNGLTGVTMLRIDRSLIGGGTRTTLWVMMAAVGFVLLIVCANLANMMLAQATGRRKEFAIASALGAGRGRLIRQMLTESTLLTAIGGMLGLLLAVWMVGVLKTLGAGRIPRLELVTIDGWVFAFTVAITVLVGILSGMVPALQVPFSNINEAFLEGGRMSSSRRQHRVRSALVVVEMALSVVLLIGAGLMIRSFIALQSVDRGFETDNRLVFDITLPDMPYEDGEQLAQFLDQFCSRVESMPVVAGFGAVSAAPIEGLNTNMGIYAAGNPLSEDEGMPLADWRYVTPAYFRTLGLPLLQGRVFADLGGQEAAPVVDRENRQYQFNVVISESLARELWSDENPIGREAVLWAMPNMMGTVIGVVGDMRERGLESEPRNAVYMSYRIGLWNPVTFIAHTTVDPVSIMGSVRGILADIDPDLPVSNIRTFDDMVTDSVSGRRFNTILLLSFAAIALVLVCAGIYGVMAYSVTERNSEIAIRQTLGARPQTILRLIVGQGMIRAMLGVLIGLASAVALSQVMRSILFDVVPLDAVTYVMVLLLLVLTALLANYIPAVRATRINPVSALREE